MPHKNLELARQLLTDFFFTDEKYYQENTAIRALLDDGDESEARLLIGEDIYEIKNKLRCAVILAGQPVQPITYGRDRFAQQQRIGYQRDRLILLATVSLALIEAGSAAREAARGAL